MPRSYRQSEVITFHEGKAIDAVIRRIETRDAIQRGNDMRSPERDGDAAPIDLACSIGCQLFAFEHTGIEPFARQIELQRYNRDLFGPIAERLAGTLPGREMFELHVPVTASAGLRRAQWPLIQDALVAWVAETAPTLPVAPLGRYITPIVKVTLPAVPFPVSLHRCAAIGPMRGVFNVIFIVSSDLEPARIERLKQACEKKFGKLAEWKRRVGARTVLVLEDIDMSLTNHQLVADALSRAEDGRDDKPDEIYLVSTFLDDPWFVTCLRREARSYYDDGERGWEIDPANLTQLTDR